MMKSGHTVTFKETLPDIGVYVEEFSILNTVFFTLFPQAVSPSFQTLAFLNLKICFDAMTSSKCFRLKFNGKLAGVFLPDVVATGFLL